MWFGRRRWDGIGTRYWRPPSSGWACRQTWRALALVVKAKLEAVDAGITVFEEEFLAHIVLPDGRTVGQFTLPQVESAYLTGKMPKLLPGLAESTIEAEIVPDE